MNKTVIFLTLASIALAGIIGQIVLAAIRPDATATFVANITVLLAVLLGAAGQIYQLGKIEKQTNGTLSLKDAHIAELNQQLIGAGIPPVAPPVGVVKAVIPPGEVAPDLDLGALPEGE